MESDLPKIVVDTPLVDIDGDEMTRVMWSYVREKVIIIINF